MDNITYASKDSKVKLTDFTVAREVKENTRLFDTEGTPAFTAPESHVSGENGYSPKPTDIWSLGVCIFTYISNQVPFYGDSELEI